MKRTSEEQVNYCTPIIFIIIDGKKIYLGKASKATIKKKFLNYKGQKHLLTKECCVYGFKGDISAYKGKAVTLIVSNNLQYTRFDNQYLHLIDNNTLVIDGYKNK